MEEDDIPSNDEKESLHVLRNKDGSVFAALMLTPSLATKINQRRDEAARKLGRPKPENWKPEDNRPEFWYLDNTSKGFIKDVLPNILTEVANDVHARAEQ
jgi:hypothetical protein